MTGVLDKRVVNLVKRSQFGRVKAPELLISVEEKMTGKISVLLS